MSHEACAIREEPPPLTPPPEGEGNKTSPQDALIEAIASGTPPATIASDLGISIVELARRADTPEVIEGLRAIARLHAMHRETILNEMRLVAAKKLCALSVLETPLDAAEARARETARHACVDIIRIPCPLLLDEAVSSTLSGNAVSDRRADANPSGGPGSAHRRHAWHGGRGRGGSGGSNGSSRMAGSTGPEPVQSLPAAAGGGSSDGDATGPASEETIVKLLEALGRASDDEYEQVVATISGDEPAAQGRSP